MNVSLSAPKERCTRTHGGRGLPADSVVAEDIASKPALHVNDVQPSNVVRGVRRRRDRATDRPEDVRVVVPREARVRAEVPDRAHPGARHGVRLEEVLSENCRGVGLVEIVDDVLDGD